MQYRFSASQLAVCATIAMGMATPSSEAAVYKDSADFSHLYEFDSVTDATDIGGGWSFTPWGHWSHVDPTASAGVLHFHGGGLYTNTFTPAPDVGYTIEMRLQIVAPVAVRNDFGLVILPPTGSSAPMHVVNVRDNAINVGDQGNPGPGGTDYAAGSSNTTDFHIVRIAVDTITNQLSLWRDGALLASNDAGIASPWSTADGGIAVLFGALGGEWNDAAATIDLDYIRIDTSGAYAPIPEPASLSLMALGAVACLSHRRASRLS